ncbi:MAG: DUF1735 domain-containing protein [Bacteroidales bacterium]
MKKTLVFLILSVAMVSCYEDYLFDYDYTAIYFPYQIDVRTFVVGEGMKFTVGVELAGVKKNTINRNVNFILDPALITSDVLNKMKNSNYSHIKKASSTVSALLPLPSNYYTLSDNSKIVINKGWHVGKITVRPDSAVFLADAATLVPTYIIPFYITSADADSILEPKRYALIGVKYENKLFGNYYHGGAALVNRPGKADTTIVYKTTIPIPENRIWTLTTLSPFQLGLNGYLDQISNKNEMILTLSGTTITISSAPGSTYTFEPEGTSSFNNAKLLQDRKLFLRYKYTNTSNGFTYHCSDTMTFRNRIRDGVNEWQDENPANYN